jgi:hypothetical protein
MYRNGKLFDLERVVFERTRGDDPHAPPASPPRKLPVAADLQGGTTGTWRDRRPKRDLIGIAP